MDSQPDIYAVIDEACDGNKFYVTIYARMQEGHYQCTSHAPYTQRPSFPTEVQAIEFAHNRGVAMGDIKFQRQE